jgi:hypothetical protein
MILKFGSYKELVGLLLRLIILVAYEYIGQHKENEHRAARVGFELTIAVSESEGVSCLIPHRHRDLHFLSLFIPLFTFSSFRLVLSFFAPRLVGTPLFCIWQILISVLAQIQDIPA